MSNTYIRNISVFTLLFLSLVVPSALSALPLSTYADKSALSSGNWVKISVKESGIHLLTNEQLRQMGFSDPSKVRVYGYGASRLPEVLSASTFVDDLPQVQTVNSNRGIYFYAVGPVSFETVSVSRFRQSLNPFTQTGYYFLTDSDSDLREIPSAGIPTLTDRNLTTFTNTVYHEAELVNPGQTGHQLLGEDFLSTRTRNFDIEMPGNVSPTINIETSFAACSAARTYFTVSVDGKALPTTSSDYLNAVTSGSHIHYSEVAPYKQYTFDSNPAPTKTKIGITYVGSGNVTVANLNYITVNYTRALRLSGLSQLAFRQNNNYLELGDANADTHVWDVTNPLNITYMPCSFSASSANFGGASSLGWRNDYSGVRQYVAWNENGSFPAPEYVGKVANQDIHACDVPDMIIFAPSAWISQAQRLADYHRNSLSNPLNVLVLDQNLVFNEFSSGAPDVQAFRKALKMFYDRSDGDRRLQYALFMGRGIYDNRMLTSAVKALNMTAMPIWESEKGNSDSSSFTTDDIFAFLKDDSGLNLSSDIYCIAVGRMPVTSLKSATQAVDKLLEYAALPQGNWQNRVLLIADDQDSGVHMEDTEKMWNNMMTSSGGSDMNYRKIYTDAYELVGGTYPGARSDMFRTLDEGIVWWTFIGHANTTSWTHENLLTYKDINNLSLKYYPLVYAATCEFLRIDARDISAAEIMWLMEKGGVIGVISANRPVYISDNGVLSRAFGKSVFDRDANGNRLTIGQIYMNAKNANLINGAPTSDSNKLRYVLMADPAMLPAIPENRVVIDSINGVDPDDPDEQAIIMARQNVVMEGHIVDGLGNPVTDINGTLSATLFDAEYSTVSKANGDAGKNVTFEQQGERIYAGNGTVKDGRFSLTVPMPSEVSNNFREATANFIVLPDNKQFESQAAGVNRNFYIYGIDDTAEADTVPPTIKTFYLNHPTFTDGSFVNLSPYVMAEIADNRGINMSNAGVGHQMTLQLDGNKTFSDVSLFYTPAVDGSASGTIAYPLSALSEGPHTLRLRIWDADGNSTSSTISFVAKEGLAPKLYDVYTLTNPAVTEAEFYLSHDRPDSIIEVTISVYNLLGKPVWTSTTTARSDLYLSTPVKWDLTDNAGRRVPRGIYVYRASVVSDGVESETLSHKIAVAGY